MPVPCCVITGGASNHSNPVPSPPLDVTRQKKTAATEFPLDMTAFKVRPVSYTHLRAHET